MSTNWDFLPEKAKNGVVFSQEDAVFSLPNGEIKPSEESNFEGETYFVQGGAETTSFAKDKSKPGRISKWDRTINMRVRNLNPAPFAIGTAIIFGRPGQLQPPFSFSEVSMPDINQGGQEFLRREIVDNSFSIQGLRMIFRRGQLSSADFTDQIREPLTLVENTINGKRIERVFQTVNGLSPTTLNLIPNIVPANEVAVIDFPTFEFVVDNNNTIEYRIRNRCAVLMYFTIKTKIDYTNVLFDRNLVSASNQPRLSGNPLADIAIESMANKALEDSNYNSTVQYAFSPRPTGNTLADIVILND
jgi:hypothetical protein